MAGEILQKQNGVQWLRTQSICILPFLVNGLPLLTVKTVTESRANTQMIDMNEEN
jgi:hypothetical protein